MRWCLVMMAAGCAGLPDVTTVDALQDGDVLATLAPADVDETVFTEDLPVSVTFALTFDETMSLPSARDHVRIEDEDGGELDVDLDARLERIEVTPSDALEPGRNHTLVVDAAGEDHSGTAMLSGYRLSFYTAEER